MVRKTAGAPVWGARQGDEMRIWVYVQNTDGFHLNRRLSRDFFEHANNYEPITEEVVRQTIREWKLEARNPRQLVERFRSIPQSEPWHQY